MSGLDQTQTVLAVIGGGLAVIAAASRAVAGLFRMSHKLGDILDDVRETKHLVKYHLGPNGTTRPMHERLKAVESQTKPKEGQ